MKTIQVMGKSLPIHIEHGQQWIALGDLSAITGLRPARLKKAAMAAASHECAALVMRGNDLWLLRSQVMALMLFLRADGATIGLAQAASKIAGAVFNLEKPRKLVAEQAQIMQDIENGQSLRKIGKKYGVAAATIFNLAKQARKGVQL